MNDILRDVIFFVIAGISATLMFLGFMVLMENTFDPPLFITWLLGGFVLFWSVFRIDRAMERVETDVD